MMWIYLRNLFMVHVGKGISIIFYKKKKKKTFYLECKIICQRQPASAAKCTFASIFYIFLVRDANELYPFFLYKQIFFFLLLLFLSFYIASIFSALLFSLSLILISLNCPENMTLTFRLWGKRVKKIFSQRGGKHCLKQREGYETCKYFGKKACSEVEGRRGSLRIKLSLPYFGNKTVVTYFGSQLCFYILWKWWHIQY